MSTHYSNNRIQCLTLQTNTKKIKAMKKILRYFLLCSRFLVSGACLSESLTDSVVQPSKQIAEWIAIRYTSEHVLNFVDMDNECSIFELKVPKKWIGKTIREINVRHVYHINIIAIKSEDKFNMSLTCDTVFTADSTMLVIGKLEDMRKFI